MEEKNQLPEMLTLFRTDGSPVRCVPHGSGHINRTWLVETDRQRRYILQQVNTSIFPDADGLMRNILLVTEHLRKKDPAPGHVLTLVGTTDGGAYIKKPGNKLWRMYEFVSGGICLERAETPEDFRLSGVAFGRFQQQMADFPAQQLTEVIPGFHDTPARYRALRRAIREDRAGRAAGIREEIDFYLEREETAGRMVSMQRAGELPTRVTHNDTKLNNVMLDEKTRQPLCILDLDTVMPGLAANDFGDAIRFGASTAAEDEPDTSRVHLDLKLYGAFAEGFLGACGADLTEAEQETLHEGARLMTLECGTRFLADYLDGDVYYHTARPDHNLDRARTQMALVRDMETNEEQIRRMIRRIGTEASI